jgi:hypothetical protein
MADTRSFEHCGTVFAPRREHARFCSARCRVAWNRENKSHPPAEVSALQWSITAMGDTTQSLPLVRAWDRPRAFAVIGEAVWWVTIVDGTLVRHHPDAYDKVLSALDPTELQLVEETMAGLRFVRNQMGHDVDHVDFICPGPSRPGPGADGITTWRWKSVPPPEVASLTPRGQAWEMTRHRAYEARLAGHPIGETFERAAEFLTMAAAHAAVTPALVPVGHPDDSRPRRARPGPRRRAAGWPSEPAVP